MIQNQRVGTGPTPNSAVPQAPATPAATQPISAGASHGDALRLGTVPLAVFRQKSTALYAQLSQAVQAGNYAEARALATQGLTLVAETRAADRQLGGPALDRISQAFTQVLVALPPSQPTGGAAPTAQAAAPAKAQPQAAPARPAPQTTKQQVYVGLPGRGGRFVTVEQHKSSHHGLFGFIGHALDKIGPGLEKVGHVAFLPLEAIGKVTDPISKWVGGALGKLKDGIDHTLGRIPVIGSGVRFATGFAASLVGLVGGVVQGVTHPVELIKGLGSMVWTLSAFLPPFLNAHMLYDVAVNGKSPVQSFKDSVGDLGALGKGLIGDSITDWEHGNYAGAIGRFTGNVASFVVTDGAGAAVDSTAVAARVAELADAAKASSVGARVSELADAARASELGAKASALADAARASDVGGAAIAGAGKALDLAKVGTAKTFDAAVGSVKLVNHLSGQAFIKGLKFNRAVWEKGVSYLPHGNSVIAGFDRAASVAGGAAVKAGQGYVSYLNGVWKVTRKVVPGANVLERVIPHAEAPAAVVAEHTDTPAAAVAAHADGPVAGEAPLFAAPTVDAVPGAHPTFLGMPGVASSNFSFGQEVVVRRSSGAMESGWLVAGQTDDGMIQVMNARGDTKIVKQNELASWQPTKAMTPALQPLFQPGRSVTVQRTSGAMEADWKVNGVLPNGHVEVINPQGATKIVSPEQLKGWNPGLHPTFTPGGRVTVLRSAGDIEDNWHVESQSPDGASVLVADNAGRERTVSAAELAEWQNLQVNRFDPRAAGMAGLRSVDGAAGRVAYNGEVVQARFNARYSSLDPASRQAFATLRSQVASMAEERMIDRAFAFGWGVPDIARYAGDMRTLAAGGAENYARLGFPGPEWAQYLNSLTPDQRVLRMSTLEGLQQHFTTSCNPTSFQVVRGELDPVYAWNGNRNPQLLIDEQQRLLQENGGVAVSRGVPATPGIQGRGTYPVAMANELNKLENYTGNHYEAVNLAGVSEIGPDGLNYVRSTPTSRAAALSDIERGLKAGKPSEIYVQWLDKATGKPAGGAHAIAILDSQVLADGTRRFLLHDPEFFVNGRPVPMTNWVDERDLINGNLGPNYGNAIGELYSYLHVT